MNKLKRIVRVMDIAVLAIYQLMVDIYKFPKRMHSGLLMALA